MVHSVECQIKEKNFKAGKKNSFKRVLLFSAVIIEISRQQNGSLDVLRILLPKKVSFKVEGRMKTF